jgi:hypothetical protein
MHRLSDWLSFIPGTSTLVLLFKAAKRRVSEQTDEIAQLPKARIASATEELNQIADDIRDAQATTEASPSTFESEARPAIQSVLQSAFHESAASPMRRIG